MNLFLDDCPHRTGIWQDKYPNGITTTKSKSLIALLTLPIQIEYLFLDHDLDGDKPFSPDQPAEHTGMEVVEWLENNHRAINQIIVHSCNIYAAPAMMSRLEAARYNVVGCPFWVLIPQLGR